MASLTVTPNPIQQGEVITATFSGFIDMVWVGVQGGGGLSVLADGSGHGSVSFTLGEIPGPYVMEAYDEVGNYAEAAFTVIPAGWKMLARLVRSLGLGVVPPVYEWEQLARMTTGLGLTPGLPAVGWIEVARVTKSIAFSTIPPSPGWVEVDHKYAPALVLKAGEGGGEDEGGSNIVPIVLGAAGLGVLLMGLQDSNKKQ